MGKISLRSYVKEIETLIEGNHMDEAITHCRHLLRTYPKHIDTYRLLAKAYLETQNYKEASDVLQRILAVIPDDFIAHIGMSLVREDEGNLDGAIWHMERAFECQTANTALQDEIRRLYGVRDGVEPPRVRLTRGALVRMYARGSHYQEAIAEILAALKEDPQRADLEVILARMYYLSGLKVEAIETCGKIIKDLPYCYEANRILAEVLPGTSRSEDAKTYQQRVIAVDPYYAFVTSSSVSSLEVSDNAIMVDRLDYQPGSEDLPISAWEEPSSQREEADTTGEDVDGTLADSTQEDLRIEPTQELQSSDEEFREILPSEGKGVEEEPSQAELEEVDQLQEETPQKSQEEDLPEWMREAGWTPTPADSQSERDSAGIDIAPPAIDAAQGSGDELAAADIPDWLKAIAPQDTPKEIPGTFEQAEEIAGKPLPPMDALEEDKGIESVESDIPEWLKEEALNTSDTEIKMEPPETTSEVEVEKQPSPEPKAVDDALAFLDGLVAEDVTGSPSVAPEPETAESAEIPEWLRNLGSGEQVSPSTEETISPVSEEAQEIPSATVDITAIPEAAAPSGDVAPAQPVESVDDLPDWLKSLDAEPQPDPPFVEGVLPSLEEKPDDRPAELIEPLMTEPEEVPDASGLGQPTDASDDLPEWLRALDGAPQAGLPSEQPAISAQEDKSDEFPLDQVEPLAPESEIPSESSTAQELQPGDDLPEWLKALDGGDQASEPSPDQDSSLLQEPGEDTPVEQVGMADLPDWLQSLDEAQPDSVTPIPEDTTLEALPQIVEEEDKPTSLESDSKDSGLPQTDLSDWMTTEEVLPSDQTEVTSDGTMVESQDTELDQPAASGPEIEGEPSLDDLKAESDLPVEDVVSETSSSQLSEEPLETTEVRSPSLQEKDAEGLEPELDLQDRMGGLISEEPVEDVKSLVEPIEASQQVEADKGQSEGELSHIREQVASGNLDDALASYSKAINEGSNLTEIIEDLKAVVESHPDDATSWQTLGDAYAKGDRLQEALDAYTRAEEKLK